MEKILYLVYGIPGSGKTTYVESVLRKSHPDIVRFEADMFFYVGDRYDFNPRKLGYAHAWCQAKVDQAMIAGKTIAVSNTSLTPSERAPYIKMAKNHGYHVVPRLMTGSFQNVHGVPEAQLEKMKKKLTPFTEQELA